jgi:hypothetical protein
MDTSMTGNFFIKFLLIKYRWNDAFLCINHDKQKLL